MAIVISVLMDLPTLVIDILTLIVALALTYISLSTLATMKAKRISTSVMRPVLLAGSGIFLLGCIFSILGFLMEIELFDLLHHLTWAIGLTFLVLGLFEYRKMLREIGK